MAETFASAPTSNGGGAVPAQRTPDDYLTPQERALASSNRTQFPTGQFQEAGYTFSSSQEYYAAKQRLGPMAQDRFNAANKAAMGVVDKTPTTVAQPTTSAPQAVSSPTGVNSLYAPSDPSRLGQTGVRSTAAVPAGVASRPPVSGPVGIRDALSRPGGPLAPTNGFGGPLPSSRPPAAQGIPNTGITRALAQKGAFGTNTFAQTSNSPLQERSIPTNASPKSSQFSSQSTPKTSATAINLFDSTNRQAIQENARLGLYAGASDVFSGTTNPQFSPRSGYSSPAGAAPLFFSSDSSPNPSAPARKQPFEYNYLSPNYFGAVGEKYQQVAGGLAQRAVASEKERRAASTRTDELKFTVLSGSQTLGAIGTQALGTGAQSGSRFIGGFAGGSVWKGIGVIAERNVGSRVAYKATGVGLAGLYIYDVSTDAGQAIRKGRNPEERITGVGDVVGGSAADLAGFGAGTKSVAKATGEPFSVADRRVTIDVRNTLNKEQPVVNVELLRGEASTTNRFAMAIGGVPAKARAGRLSKAELRERKAPVANIPTYEVTRNPNDVTFDLRGKQRFNTEQTRILQARFEREQVDTRTVVSDRGAVGFVKQPESRFTLVSADVAVRGTPAPRIAPSNAPPPTTDFWRPAKKSSNMPLFLGENKPKTPSVRPESPQQVITLRQDSGQRTLERGRLTQQGFFPVQAQERSSARRTTVSSPYAYGGASFARTLVPESVVPEYAPPVTRQQFTRGSPEDRQARALERLRNTAARYREQQSNQRVGFPRQREVSFFKEPARPAFQTDQRSIARQRSGTEFLADSRAMSNTATQQSLRRDTAQRQRTRFSFGMLPAQAQLPLQDTALSQATLPVQDTLPVPFSDAPRTPRRPEDRVPRIPIPSTMTPISPPPRTVTPPPFIPRRTTPPPPPPPDVPVPGVGLPNWGLGSGTAPRGKTSGRGFRYAQDLTSQIFNVRGSKPTGRLTGFEARPINTANFQRGLSIQRSTRKKRR